MSVTIAYITIRYEERNSESRSRCQFCRQRQLGAILRTLEGPQSASDVKNQWLNNVTSFPPDMQRHAFYIRICTSKNIILFLYTERVFLRQALFAFIVSQTSVRFSATVIWNIAVLEFLSYLAVNL
ncbi:hypothetical protein BaRGS_00004863 [Batillaria attramentaria]|uniref:Uncharacterized protein n=1 Tax=Batillaria attramentaria TaxID=370345 RepID=A0ABD0LW50_9CAEN